jgi:hypothetical protein
VRMAARTVLGVVGVCYVSECKLNSIVEENVWECPSTDVVTGWLWASEWLELHEHV